MRAMLAYAVTVKVESPKTCCPVTHDKSGTEIYYPLRVLILRVNVVVKSTAQLTEQQHSLSR